MKIVSGVCIAVIVLAGIIPRFWGLDKFPAGMSHDELEYILSAKSYWQQGTDLSGVGLPLSAVKTKTEGIISFLPAVLLAPFYGPQELSQTAVRWPYALLSLLTGGMVFLVARELLANNKAALLAAAAYLLSPWGFYFSRMASDAPWALFFGLAGIYWLIRKKGGYEWVSFLLLAAAFFSYHGAKFVIPLAAAAAWWYRLENKKAGDKRKAVVFVTAFGLMTVAYFATLKLIPDSIMNSRQSDIVFLNQELLGKEVNRQRKLSVETPLTRLTENKVTASVNIFVNNYLKAFSPEVLFIEGDNRATYKFGEYGLLHKFESLMIVAGLIGLFVYKRGRAGRLLVVAALLAAIPTGVSTVEVSVINRSFLLLPIMSILSGYGMYLTGQSLERIIPAAEGIAPGLLLLFWGYFLHFYFFRFPKVNQESYFLSERISANYIALNSGHKTAALFPENRAMYLESVFYSGKNDRIEVEAITKGSYRFGSTEFLNGCPEVWARDKTYLVHRSMEKCIPDGSKKLSINEEQFDGPLVFIVQDKLCEGVRLEPWIADRKTTDYGVEKLTKEEFCRRWITRR